MKSLRALHFRFIALPFSLSLWLWPPAKGCPRAGTEENEKRKVKSENEESSGSLFSLYRFAVFAFCPSRPRALFGREAEATLRPRQTTPHLKRLRLSVKRHAQWVL
jgi:hypothetical protein